MDIFLLWRISGYKMLGFPQEKSSWVSATETAVTSVPKCLLFSHLCPLEPARIQPVYDGREEEAEGSGDAGAQGSSRNQREPRQRLLASTEMT